MSRFFAAQSSSSESESVSEGEEIFVKPKEPTRRGLFESLSMSEYSDEDSDEGSGFSEGESEAESEASEQAAQPVRKSRFVFDTDSDMSEEESTQRQVRSQKEKAHDEMFALVDSIEEASNKSQWRRANDDFDKLFKAVTKSQATHGVPRAIFVVLPALEKNVGEYAAGPELKNLNAEIAKSFNALRQKLRKTISQYADQIKRAEEAGDDDDVSVADNTSVSGGKPVAAPESKATELTPETLLKRLQEINSTRGRKNIDKQENVATLRKMLNLSMNRRHSIHVYVSLSAYGMETVSGSMGYMPFDSWTVLLSDLTKLVNLFEEEDKACSGKIPDLKPDEEEHGLPTMIGIRGTIISYSQRADDEFVRALQNIDPHSSEYVDFLRDEPKLYYLLGKCSQILLNLTNQMETACQMIVRQLEHVYHRKHEIIHKYFDPESTVLGLCRTLYAHAGDKAKIRALLYHIYWLSIQDQYVQARDLMLMSHIQEALPSLDISTQILYNRALVQLGLAAFRSGHLKETYFALQELCSTGRPKELLAQGMIGQKYTEKGEMDRNERQRLIPFHMQINIETIDCIFLVVSMLLEIPQQAATSRRYFQGERRLYQSRHLRRILDNHDRTLFNGPPENTREYIVAATKALANGNWRECECSLMAVKLWDSLPKPAAIRALLRHKVRESGLYAFIYSTGNCYSSLSIEKLSKDFDLPIALVVRIVTKLISDHGVPAVLNADNQVLEWNLDSDITSTQEAILTLGDKVNYLRERNEETAELINNIQYGTHSRNPSSRPNHSHHAPSNALSPTLASPLSPPEESSSSMEQDA